MLAVFHAGPHDNMNWFSVGGSGGQTAAGTRPGGDMMNGNAVMYDSGKIHTCGGAHFCCVLTLPSQLADARITASPPLVHTHVSHTCMRHEWLTLHVCSFRRRLPSV